jgi:hypothetical protein
VQLEPGNLTYANNYGYVLLNAGKTADARVLTGRIKAAAKKPAEQAGANSLANYDKQVAEFAERSKHAMEEAAAEPVQTSTTRVVPAQAATRV